MVSTLHLVPRSHPGHIDPLALHLAGGPEGRVVEMFDAPPSSPVADLSLAERDLPELVSVLLEVEEVHVHGTHPVWVLRMLPAVRPGALERTALVLHAPWAPLRHEVALRDAPLQRWPGPIACDDDAALASLDPVLFPDPHRREPMSFVDAHRAELLPRACGAEPISLPDGRRLATVILSAALDEAVRADLHHALPSIGLPDVVVAVHDEAISPQHEWAAARRAAQAYVAHPASRRELEEAVLQGIPTVVLDPSGARARAGGVVRACEVDRVVACLRAWSSAWAQGRPGGAELQLRAAGWVDPRLDA